MILNTRRLARSVAATAAAVVVLAGGAGIATASTTELNDQDRAFLIGSHQSNLAEIATGKLAQSKGQSQEVKDLGAMLVADHTKLDAAARPLAQRGNVKLPAAPNAEQRALAAKLTAASASEFDALFVAGQIAAHAKAMRIGEAEISGGQDPAVVAAAKNAAPVIMKHHHEAQALARAMDLPVGVDAGRSGEAGGSPVDVPVGLVGLGALLVAAGVVVAVRRPAAAVR